MVTPKNDPTIPHPGMEFSGGQWYSQEALRKRKARRKLTAIPYVKKQILRGHLVPRQQAHHQAMGKILEDSGFVRGPGEHLNHKGACEGLYLTWDNGNLRPYLVCNHPECYSFGPPQGPRTTAAGTRVRNVVLISRGQFAATSKALVEWIADQETIVELESLVYAH